MALANEASKTKAIWGTFEHQIVSGEGIDIGCGTDPITDNVRRFDVDDGDANEITQYVTGQFEFVFSCHTLEHMHDPQHALHEWWQLVKPGGHMIVITPDEDLYEQGYFPSLFNDDHKSTFTLSKERSWSPRSFNLIDLVHTLKNARLIKMQLQDNAYDRRLLYHSVYSRQTAFRLRRMAKRLSRITRAVGLTQTLWSRLLRAPIDQTSGEALAQNEVIVRKDVN